MNTCGCQIQSVPKFNEGPAEYGPLPLQRRLRLELKRRLNDQAKRKLKRFTNRIITIFSTNTKETEAVSSLIHLQTSEHALNVGDLVLVRSREEIEATLDHWNELKGCLFMDAMWQYCNTKQKIFKIVERFVDERDYQVKKTKGIVLLDNLVCEGTPDYGRCDRACFYFWRAEWLQKIEAGQ